MQLSTIFTLRSPKRLPLPLMHKGQWMPPAKKGRSCDLPFLRYPRLWGMRLSLSVEACLFHVLHELVVEVTQLVAQIQELAGSLFHCSLIGVGGIFQGAQL